MRRKRRGLGLCALAIVSGVVFGVGSGAGASSPMSRIVFSRGLAPDRYEIWTARADGRQLRRVGPTCGWNWWPAVSTDGRKIAFAHACNSTFDLYVVNVDGTHLHRVVRRPGNDAWPTWSPDGRRIAFVGGDDRSAELYIVNVNGTGLKRLTHNTVEDTAPAWSPDGSVILYTSRRGATNPLMVITPDGRRSRGVGNLRGGEAAWSPDGHRIAFARRQQGSDETETVDLFVANADGTRLHRLTHEKVGIVSHHPSWSPNGRRIVFMSNHGARLQGASLFVVHADGTGLRRLTHASFEDADPMWLPATARASG